MLYKIFSFLAGLCVLLPYLIPSILIVYFLNKRFREKIKFLAPVFLFIGGLFILSRKEFTVFWINELMEPNAPRMVIEVGLFLTRIVVLGIPWLYGVIGWTSLILFFDLIIPHRKKKDSGEILNPDNAVTNIESGAGI